MADDEKKHEFSTSSRRDKDYRVYDEFEVEKFMVDGMHFSHNHPLSLTINNEEEGEDKQEEEVDDDGHNFCRICGLPIFASTPAYACTKDNNAACKFFLHQQCALKLPPTLTRSTHRRYLDVHYHALRIVKRSSSTNFMTYECEDCDFKIHPLVEVSGVEIKITHKSHLAHQMVAVCKEIACECGVCGKVHQGFFFACHDCNFWIHQDCTTLPNAITFANHRHPFILAYSLPTKQIDQYCLVCNHALMSRRNGVYFCPQTSYFAHVACGMEKSASKISRLELMQLPGDELNAFPVSVIRRYAETMKPLSPNAGGDNVVHDDYDKFSIDKYHNHTLIETHEVNSNTTKESCNLACNLCTRPIPTEVSSPLYYKSVGDCHFVSHKICWDILPTLKLIFPDLGLSMARIYGNVSSYMFSSIFHCRFCHRPCNGVCFLYPHSMLEGLPLFIDLECMVAPATVHHASHQHILYRTTSSWSETRPVCCPQKLALLYDVYRCIICEHFIHIRCAMLPKRIVYPAYHHHPLHLLFTTNSIGRDNHEYQDQDSSSFCFCEVCEEALDLNYWFYRCSQCDQSFHINCIPAVGFLSKVKFGGEYSLPDIHIHPLRLKRMLTLHSQRCGHCKLIIQGLVDQIAFFCSRCHFWLHFSCAAAAHNRNASDELKLYSDFDDDAWFMTKEECGRKSVWLYFSAPKDPAMSKGTPKKVEKY